MLDVDERACFIFWQIWSLSMCDLAGKVILQSQWKPPHCYSLCCYTTQKPCPDRHVVNIRIYVHVQQHLYWWQWFAQWVIAKKWMGSPGHSISELTFQKMRQDTAVLDFEAWPSLPVISHLGKHLHHHYWRTDKMQCPCQAHVKHNAMLSLLLLAFLHQPYLAFSDSAPRSRHNVASPSL